MGHDCAVSIALEAAIAGWWPGMPMHWVGAQSPTSRQTSARLSSSIAAEVHR